MKIRYGLFGLFFGALLFGLTPTAMAAGTRTIDKVLKKVKVTITKVDNVQSSIDSTQDDVIYSGNLTEDMYDNAYYQSELLNNIAYNSYISCIYASGSTDSCISPSESLIDTPTLFNYEVGSMSATSVRTGQSGKQNSDTTKEGNITKYKSLLQK